MKKRSNSAKGKLARRKGHAFEREIAKIFQQNGWPEAKRHLEYQAAEVQGVDLDNTWPFAVQCKRGRSYAPINKIFEVQESETGHVPLLVTKGDNQPIMAVLSLADLITLIRGEE